MRLLLPGRYPIPTQPHRKTGVILDTFCDVQLRGITSIPGSRQIECVPGCRSHRHFRLDRLPQLLDQSQVLDTEVHENDGS